MQRSLLLLAGGLLLAGAAFALTRRAPPPPIRMGVAAPATSLSNVMPRDYVGPESCRECHQEKYDAWKAHPHSRMNRDASDDSVRGDFSGVSEEYLGGRVTFERDAAGERLMRLERGETKRVYRVTRVVGSRFMQFYLGVQVEGPEPRTDRRYSEDQKLPFGYWFKLRRWLPTNYFDPVGAETAPDGTPVYEPFDRPRVHYWAANCMLCHNTMPYAYRVSLPDNLSGFDPGDLQVAAEPFKAELAKTQDVSLPPRERMKPEHLVRMGVSCESCHFGGRAHANDPQGVPATYLPANPFLRLSPRDPARHAAPDKKNPYAIAGICGQCHCATITQFPNGAGTWNSREALDLAGSACAQQARCTDCHDPHVSIGSEAQKDRPEHVAACVRCHGAQDTREHARHDGVSCLDCHQPRYTQGLEEVVRTHRVARPVEPVMARANAPNACNLCHLDRSLRWTLDAIEEGWGKKLDLPATDAPVGPAWLAGDDPSTRLVAGQAYARSPLGKEALPLLVRALDDPVAVNRVFATFAVERVRGRPVSRDELDVLAPPEKRRAQVEAMLRALGR